LTKNEDAVLLSEDGLAQDEERYGKLKTYKKIIIINHLPSNVPF
jgi:hypothetical protein